MEDPDVYRDKYSPIAGQTAKEHGGEALVNSSWEVLHGDGSRTSGALMRFPDHETALDQAFEDFALVLGDDVTAQRR